MPTCHSKGREEPSVVLSHGRSIISLPKNLWWRSTKKNTYSSILDRFHIDEVCHASQLQHNCTEEWCEYVDSWEQSIFRTEPLQKNWNETLRCVIFGIIQNVWSKALWKVVQIITKQRGPLSAWTKKQVRLHRLYQEDTNVVLIWTQRSSNGSYGFHTIGNGTSRWTDTQI